MNDTTNFPTTSNAIYNEMQYLIGDAVALLDVLTGLLGEWPISESEAERKRLGNVCVVASIAQEKAEQAQRLSMCFVDVEQAEHTGEPAGK